MLLFSSVERCKVCRFRLTEGTDREGAKARRTSHRHVVVAVAVTSVPSLIVPAALQRNGVSAKSSFDLSVAPYHSMQLKP